MAFLVGGSALVLLACAYIWLAGSAVVVDETDGVASASIVAGDGSEQRLHRLWRGYFYAIPRLEGAIRVRCRDGTGKEEGYASGQLHTKIRVVGDSPCARLIAVR